MAATHPLEEIANDLVQEMIDEIKQQTDDLLAGYRAPFTAQITEAQKLAYYTQQFFSPDGSPNLAGRAQEMQRLGPEQFADTFRAVLKAHPDLQVPPPPAGVPVPSPLAA